MITKMTKYTFVLISGKKDEFLEDIQELGVVDITRSTKAIDEHSERLMREIEDIKKHISQIKAGSNHHLDALTVKVDTLTMEERNLRPWGDFDREKLKALGLDVHFGLIRKKEYREVWSEDYPMEIVSEDEHYCHVVIFGDVPDIPVELIPMPQKNLSEVQSELKLAQEAADRYKNILESCRKDIPLLEKKEAELTAELNLYLASNTAESAVESEILIFQGFAPTEDNIRLAEALDSMDIIWFAEDAVKEDNPPIKLKNNWFSRQFEVLTSMYGMPVYDEFDPTIFLSIFFLLFFAMCMGDAGYGLLLIAIGYSLKGKEGGLANLWSLIITLGVATFVVGIVMGGFFGIDLSAQAWVPDGLKKIMITGNITIGGSTYAKQMVLSLGIGVLHICLALIVKTIWTIRNNGVKNSLGTIGWTLLIVGGIIALAIGLTGVISENAMKWTLIIIAGVSALGIYFFNKWGRNPLVNLGAGLWDTYNTASGLMGDVLSYIRLYALGLSGSMLGSTFNQIAEMVKGTDPTWQWIPFVIILIIGHALNLAMSCLGAFVHPLRLNFVEFFKNSDYQGKGAQYNPLKK